MIRGKGEALSPVKINRNVWSNPAVQVKGLFTVSAAPPPSGLRVGEKMEGEGEKKGMKEAKRGGSKEQESKIQKHGGETDQEPLS